TDSLAYAPSMPNRIYASQNGGTAVSNDGGASFGMPVSVASENIAALAVDPTNPDIVYAAATSSGVYTSRDGGVSWSLSSKGIESHRIPSVGVVPGASGTVLATRHGAVLRTIDGGASWAAITPPGQQDVTVHVDPHVSTRLYLCGFNYFATSDNGGASFTGGNVTGLPAGVCTRLVVAGTTFFAASGHLFKSLDSGATWADTGLPTNLYVHDVALGSADGTVVVAATGSGIYRSIDGGTSFTQVTNFHVTTIAADPKVPTSIVIPTTTQCGYQRSTDGGATFGGFVAGPCVTRLSGVGSTLYAAGNSSDATVLEASTDGGAHWTSIDTSGVAYS